MKILLGFLDQCDGPLSSIELRAESHDEVMITTPFHWVNILNLSTIDMADKDSLAECRLYVAKNLSPLIKCMCDTSERKLFQSNGDWHGALDAFVRIIGNTIQTEETVQHLICHEELINLLLQSMFFITHRPDILSETFADKDTFSKIAENAECIVRILFRRAGKIVDGRVSYGEGDLSMLKAMASAPIINTSGDSECTIPFVLELTRRLNSGEGTKDPFSGMLFALIENSPFPSLIYKRSLFLIFPDNDSKPPLTI